MTIDTYTIYATTTGRTIRARAPIDAVADAMMIDAIDALWAIELHGRVDGQDADGAAIHATPDE